MQEELSFEVNKATLENLSILSEQYSKISERRMCELQDAAALAASFFEKTAASGFLVYEIFSLISPGLNFGERSIHSKALVENGARLKKMLSMLAEGDMCLFVDLLCRECSVRNIPLKEDSFLQPLASEHRFVYVRNAYADEAYDVFSENYEDATVDYAKDFRECVRSVLDGRRDFCLLPLEESGGARIANVLELVYFYDLKIVGVTSVFGQDGTADLKYAMVGRNFLIRNYLPDDDRYLEIRLGRDGVGLLSAVLSAAEYFGNRLYRVNTVSLRDTEGENFYYSVVFHNGESDFSALLTYLTFFREDFIPVGIYTNLE